MDFDIAIIGAGPAGATCLLGLAGKGLRVLVIEKARLPREKACGDAVPGMALRVWEEMAPELVQCLHALPSAKPLAEGFVCGPYGGRCRVTFKRPGLVVKRAEMDEAVFNYALEKTECQVAYGALANLEMLGDATDPDGIHLTLADGRTFTTRYLVGADGASGPTRRLLTGKSWEPKDYSVAVRAYLKAEEAGVGGKALSLWFDRSILPGYLWAFPLADGTLNVGSGILGTQVGRPDRNLKEALRVWLATTPSEDERPHGSPDPNTWLGQKLPTAFLKSQVYGQNWLLLGDAAGLISPATGDGIGNAVLSGQLAAEALVSVLKGNGEPQVHMTDYHRQLENKLSGSFRQQQRMVTLGQWFPFGLEAIIRVAAWLPPLRRKLASL